MLTSDFSYLDEDVDEKEIDDYIQFINEKDEKDNNKEDNDYGEMFKGIAKNIKNADEMNNVFTEILLTAIKSENIDLVKYILSLDKITFQPNEIFIYFFNQIFF